MKIDFKKIKKVYLNEGKFSADEVYAAALIKTINPNIEFERKIQMNKNNESDFFIEVDDKLFNLYEKANEKIKEDRKLSLTAFIFNFVKKDLIKKYNITNRECAMKLCDSRIVEKASKLDLYDRICDFPEHRLIELFNCNQYEEEKGITDNNQQFRLAVEFVEIILENRMREIYECIEIRKIENKIWKEAEKNSEDGIYVLEESIPWQYQVRKNPNSTAKIIIYKSDRGGYNVVSRNQDEVKVQKSDYLSFIHPSQFMGVAQTLQNAILAAKNSLGLQLEIA